MNAASEPAKRVGLVHVVVPEDVRANVEMEAKSLCEEREVKYEQLNQSMCAVAIARALKSAGADFSKCGKTKEEVQGKVFAILKVGSNASALRQAISGSKKSVQVVAMDPDLL